MALFKITVKQTLLTNGQRVEKGMSVELASSHGNPVTTNGGKDVADAFMRKYGVDLKKAHALSSVYLETVKI